MKRELKFRTWDGEQMIILPLAGLQYFDFEGSYALSFAVDGYDGFWSHEQYDTMSKKADKFPIMQYTGLKDKNGVDIYEGDIVKQEKWIDVGKYIETIGVVKYLGINFTSDCVGDWEGSNAELNGNASIIGNIYENPELLETKNV